MTRSFAVVALSAAILTNAKPNASPEENALAASASAYTNDAVVEERGRSRRVQDRNIEKRTPSHSPYSCPVGFHFKRSASSSPKRCGPGYGFPRAVKREVSRGRQLGRTSEVVKRSPSNPWKKFYKHAHHHGYGYGYPVSGFGYPGYGFGFYGACGYWKRDVTDGGLDKRSPDKSAKQDLNYARGCARFRKRELAQEVDAGNTQIAGEYSSDLIEQKRSEAEAKYLENQPDFDALARTLRERGISANELSAILDSVAV